MGRPKVKGLRTSRQVISEALTSRDSDFVFSLLKEEVRTYNRPTVVKRLAQRVIGLLGSKGLVSLIVQSSQTKE